MSPHIYAYEPKGLQPINYTILYYTIHIRVVLLGHSSIKRLNDHMINCVADHHL